jgi:hypothetical protein
VNCQRIQSSLSAYMDGELTGEEMLLIRRHLSTCEYCSDEFSSLQIVKRLLGSLEPVNADKDWSSTLTVNAFVGNRPWWEKSISSPMFVLRFTGSFNTDPMSPRGVRMVRALALSTIFVLLAAVPLSSIERMDRGVTGRIADGIVSSMLPWTSAPTMNSQSLSSVFQPSVAAGFLSADPGPVETGPRYTVQSAPAFPDVNQPSWSSGNSLTLVSAAHN